MANVGFQLSSAVSRLAAARWQRAGAGSSGAFTASCRSSRTLSFYSLARASSAPSNGSRNSSEPPFNLMPPEDVGYVAKLTVGSVVGAAVVKYGSVLFPDVTRPNLEEALLIMGLPVVVAVVWLAVASLKWREGQ